MTNLKRIRTDSGISRVELSERSGVKLTAIRDYEQGHKPINKCAVISVYNMAQVLKCKTEDLIEIEG